MSKNQHSYTLVEVLVVVSIMLILLLIALPGIRAMQSSSARANAYNLINAALQAARSYAIMNGVNTAARFQPNGKVFLVYKFEGNGSSQATDWSNNPLDPYPASGNPNSDGYIYLPVINQKPLRLPSRYAVTDPGNDFEEPFYICYTPDGTLAKGEKIFVALIDDATSPTPKPVNPDFDGQNGAAWKSGVLGGTYNLSSWINETRNDVTDVDDVNDRKLARYYYVAGSDADREKIFGDQNVGPDHYAGSLDISGALFVQSSSQIALFETPDNWNTIPLFVDPVPSDYTKSKQTYVDDATEGVIAKNEFETIYINPYTGRIIRPIK